MATITDTKDNFVQVTPNIFINIDENNIGEMFIHDDKYRYVLNGITAGDLVVYFTYENNPHLAEEIKDAMMNLTINQGTH